MLELSLFSLSFSIVAILVVGKLFGVSRKLGRAKEKDGKKLIYWDQLPGRWNPFLLSDLLEARKAGDDIVNRYWFQRYREFGKFFRSYFPGRPQLIGTFDVETVDYVMKINSQNYVKGEEFYKIFGPLLGDGIFVVDGMVWKKQRNAASHMFSIKELKYMVDIFNNHGKIVLEIFEEKLQKKEPIDLQEFFVKYTLDCFCEIAFGVDINNLQHENPFSTAVDNANTYSVSRFFNPLWKIMPWSKTERLLRKNLQDIDTFVYSIIQQRKTENSTSNRFDLLSRYLSLSDEDGIPFTDKFLRDMMLNVLYK